MAKARGLFLFVSALLVSMAVWPKAQQLQKITINYPTRSGASWHLYIAKEGGYYQKYGLDVDLQFGVHPAGIAMLTSGQAVMVNHSLEQGMVASSKDAGTFALMGSSSTRRTTTRSRCSARSASAPATCNGFRSAPTSAAAPRRSRATARTPR